MVKKVVAMTVVRRRVGLAGMFKVEARRGVRNRAAAVVYKRSNCGAFELVFAIISVFEVEVDNIRRVID